MKKVCINGKGYALGPYSMDATTEIEVSDEVFEKVCQGRKGKVWKYDESKKDFDLIDHYDENDARMRRQAECFPIINRGALWYDTLTDIQKAELRTWYLSWLDVTETKIIPDKPDWLD